MIQLRVLGSLQITAFDKTPIEGLRSRSRRAALLAYLAVAASRAPQRRDKVLALFWPDSDEVRARSALNQALYVIRGELTDAAIMTRGDDIALDPDAVWCDAVEFERALDSGRAADALALYRGDLLDGFFVDGAPEFEQWVERERARLRRRAADAAWTLAEERAEHGQLVDAERWARYATDLLPADEAVVRRLMTFLHRHGDRAAAIEAYERFATMLRGEYELQPSAETSELAGAMRNDARGAAAPDISPGAAPAPSHVLTPAPSDVVTRAPSRRHRNLALAAAAAVVVLTAMIWSGRDRPVSTARAADVYALEYYQRGRQHSVTGFSELNNRLAQEMYERAIAADSGFALAYARLAETHALAYWFHYDRSAARIEAAKRAVERAIALKPDLPEAYLALGYYHYWGHLAYDDALAAFQRAHALGLNSAELFKSIGNVKRRQGKLDEAIAQYETAFVRDPGDLSSVFNLAQTYALARRFDEAERHYDRAIALNPNSAPSYWNKAWLYLSAHDGTRQARSALDMAVGLARDSVIESLTAWIDMVDGRHEDALRRLSTSPPAVETQWHFVPTALLRAEIYDRQGRPDLARTQYDSARALAERRILAQPDESHLRGAHALALAGLGRAREAIDEARRGVQLLPVSADAVRGLHRIEDLAKVYAKVGMSEAALTELERLVGLPGGRSITFLAVDPAWQTLRDTPRFRRLRSRSPPT